MSVGIKQSASVKPYGTKFVLLNVCIEVTSTGQTVWDKTHTTKSEHVVQLTRDELAVLVADCQRLLGVE